jgi:hypothetical protein
MTTAMQLTLPKYVYLCLTHNGAVFLNVRKNRYYGLGGAEINTLRSAMLSAQTADRSATSLVDELVEKGLLCRGDCSGRTLEQIQMSAGRIPLISTFAHDPDPVRPSLSQISYFAYACARAAVLKNLGSLEHVIERVKARRPSSQMSDAFDLQRARELVSVCRYLRPLFYAGRRNCLLDSLVTLEFLALYELFPTWVFGVRTAPFAAHCWVQYDDYIVNDRPEYVADFTPILAA